MVDEKKKKATRKAGARKSGTSANSKKKSATARPKVTKTKTATKVEPEKTNPLEKQFGSFFEGISDRDANEKHNELLTTLTDYQA